MHLYFTFNTPARMVKLKQWTILEACLLLHNVFYLDLDTSTKLTEISVHDTFCYVTKDRKN